MAEKTQSGLEQNIAGALCYFFGPLGAIFFLVTEKENKFVRFHAMQSIIATVVVIIAQIVVGIIGGITLVGMILVPLLGLATFAGWIFLMYKAFNNEEFMVPYIGEMANKQINK